MRIAAKTCLSDRSGLLAFVGNAFARILSQIVSLRVNTLSNTNLILVASCHIFKGIRLLSRLTWGGLKKLPKLPNMWSNFTPRIKRITLSTKCCTVRSQFNEYCNERRKVGIEPYSMSKYMYASSLHKNVYTTDSSYHCNTMPHWHVTVQKVSVWWGKWSDSPD